MANPLTNLQLDSAGNLKVNIAASGAGSVEDWGGTEVSPATADAPTGTESAPVVRSIDFKSSQTVVNGSVPSGTINSPWQDSQKTGAIYAETTAVVSIPAPALVQYNSGSTSVAFTSNVTKGNLLFYAGYNFNYAPSDSQGNTWYRIDGGSYYNPETYYAIASTTGACTVSSGDGSFSFIIAEFSGVNTLDVYAFNSNSGGDAVSSGNTTTTTYPIELVLNVFVTTNTFTESAGDNATEITSLGSDPEMYLSYSTTTQTGVQSANGSQSEAGSWDAFCIAFYSSANAVTNTSLGLQETDDTSNSQMISTFASAPITGASIPFTAQGTISKRYYCTFFTTPTTVSVEQTLTSSSEIPELLDLSGNQKFIFGSQFQSGTTWSSSTPGSSTQTLIDSSGVPCIVVQLNQSTGTFSAGAVIFEGTRDGQNWETIPPDIMFDPKTLTAAANPYTLVTNTNQSFLIQTTGYVTIRLRLSTAITGTGTVTPYINTTAYDPLPLDSGIYSETSPALANGQAAAIQLDNAGGLRVASPTAFHSAQATSSGSTAIWTPATGKKFRLQQFRIQVTGDATISAGGVVTIELLDGSTDLNLTHDVFVPATAFSLGDDFDSGWVDLGAGLQSATANNVLNVSLSTALSAGNVRVIAGGIEE